MGVMTFLLPNSLPAGLDQDLQRACIAGGQDNMPWPSIVQLEAGPRAQEVLDACSQSAEQLVHLYVEQMYHARHQRQPKLETGLGCCLGGAVHSKEALGLLRPMCNMLCLAFSWGEVEPSESS